MTERSLELSLLLPRAAECGGCVDEMGRELLRLDGIHAVETDVPRGLISVRFDEDALAATPSRPSRGAPAPRRTARTTARSRPTSTGRSTSRGRCPARTPASAVSCTSPAWTAPTARSSSRARCARSAACAARTSTSAPRPWPSPSIRRRRACRTSSAPCGASGTTRWNGAPRTRSRTRRPATARAGLGFWLAEPRAIATIVSGAFTAAGFVASAAAPAAAPWLFGAAVVSGGLFVARAAVFSLRARQVDMNVLMTLAMIGAAAIGQWSEAALVAFLFSLGTVLQVATLERTRRAISGLMQLAPLDRDGAAAGGRRRRRRHGETSVAVAEIVVGDVVVVRPGERAAVDGVVVEGTAAADQAPVTGESIPVAKGPGDQVFAGSIIEGGSLHVRATAAASDTTIAKIVHMVEEAQAQRAPAETIVDRFASRYTPVVVALAAAVAFIPPLLGASFDTWFYRGLALLIISCPCALVISTPVSILAALARATRNGVLIKGGAYLEQMAGIKAIAFDKTGTLTRGRPAVTDVVPLNGASPARVLEVAASAGALQRAPAGQGDHATTRRPRACGRGRRHAAHGCRRGRGARDRRGSLLLRGARLLRGRRAGRTARPRRGRRRADTTPLPPTSTSHAVPTSSASAPSPGAGCGPSWTAGCTSPAGRTSSARTPPTLRSRKPSSGSSVRARRPSWSATRTARSA